MFMQNIKAKRGPGRPPKIDSEQRSTKERMLRSGIELLTEYGFASVGLERVLKQTGVPKGSFYHYFSSKEDFAQQVVVGYGKYFAAKLDLWLLNEQRLPLQRIMDFINDGKQGLLRYQFRRGCLVGNMGQEVAATHPLLRDQLEAVFIDWQRRIEACLLAAKVAGQIADDVDCAVWANYFWIGWEGAILRAKLSQSVTSVDVFTKIYFASLPGCNME
ncbi:MAG: TetR/AcrR family transcriptional regulator [Gammaproteobacteria bacterium]|jgi:TetR/AcrR family transcriptional repressor of nem operon|nr:TetR/AcrR family transcriptional regulator [Gammaproteobacteria bacterium]